MSRPASARAAYRPAARLAPRNRRKPNFALWLRNLLTLALLAQVGRIAFTSPVLEVRRVDVAGSQRLSSAEVVKLAELELNTNVFLTNLSAAARAMRSDPIIKEVRLTRLPPDTLQVKIVDRQPALIVRSAATRWEVDADGLLYREAAGPEPDLPAVRLPVEMLPRVGETLDAKTWKSVNGCIDLASREQLVLSGIELTATRELWIDLELEKPQAAGEEATVLPIRIGREEDLPQKFHDIRVAVLTWPAMARACRYLDVMCPERPAFKTGERYAANVPVLR